MSAIMPKILYERIIKDSYSWTPQTAFIRTEMEVGPMRQRQRASTMPTTLTFKMMLDRERLSVLEAWYKYKLENGAAWFLMPIESGEGKVETSVRFSEPYQVSLYGYDCYFVSCNLEINDMPMMTEEKLEQYLD